MLRTGRRKDDALGWFSLALGDLAAARSQSTILRTAKGSYTVTLKECRWAVRPW